MKTILFLLLLAPAAYGAPVNEGVFAPERLSSVLGQDGVTPIPIKGPDGTMALLWTFGDTILGGWKGAVVTTATLDFGAMADMTAMPCNTMALSPALSSSNYRSPGLVFYAPGGAVKEFIGYREGENPFVKRIWAAGGAHLGENIYVYYMDVDIDKTVTGGFVFRGGGLARARLPRKAGPEAFAFERVDGFSAPGLAVGDSALRRGKYLYALGRLSKAGDGRLTSLALLRVKPRYVEDFSRYEFLTNKGKWSRKERGAFFDDVGGEASLVFDPVKKIYRIIYMSFAEQKVKAAEFRGFRGFAKAPAAVPLYAPPSKPGALYYSAKEIFSDAGNIYLIYMDPSIYQPVLVRVPR
jgi:hypothetical protein